MPRILDNSQRFRYAIIFQWIVVGASLLSMASEASQYVLLRQMGAGIEVADGAADASDWREQVMGSTQFVLMLLAFIALVLWTYRAYENLHGLRQFPRLRHSAGAAGWGWFVPILSLWYPYQVMRDIWHLTQRYERPAGTEGYERDHTLIGGWWALRLLTIYASRGFKAPVGGETIERIQNYVLFLIGMDVLHIWCALATIYLLKKLHLFEQGLAARVADDEPSPSPEKLPVAPAAA